MIGLVLAAAGSGSRFGAQIPKQFTLLQGKPLYFHSLEAFSPFLSEGVLVVPAGWENQVREQIQPLSGSDKFKVALGGAERQDSVVRGLEELSEAVEIVLVHDAARPFVSPALIRSVIEGARRHGGCVPVIRISETVKEVEASRVVRTLDRSRLRLAQTPQGFRRDLLKMALEKAIKEGFYGTDESSVVEWFGSPVHMTDGEAGNVKVTWKEDAAI
ncbi:MAG: 2-C-methyl-D-erythritol 4-phosphate cytidylyltransferase [Acidobacteriota bacterium]